MVELSQKPGRCYHCSLVHPSPHSHPPAHPPAHPLQHPDLCADDLLLLPYLGESEEAEAAAMCAELGFTLPENLQEGQGGQGECGASPLLSPGGGSALSWALPDLATLLAGEGELAAEQGGLLDTDSVHEAFAVRPRVFRASVGGGLCVWDGGGGVFLCVWVG